MTKLSDPREGSQRTSRRGSAYSLEGDDSDAGQMLTLLQKRIVGRNY